MLAELVVEPKPSVLVVAVFFPRYAISLIFWSSGTGLQERADVLLIRVLLDVEHS